MFTDSKVLTCWNQCYNYEYKESYRTLEGNRPDQHGNPPSSDSNCSKQVIDYRIFGYLILYILFKSMFIYILSYTDINIRVNLNFGYLPINFSKT